MHFIQAPDHRSDFSNGCGQSLDCIFHKLTSCTHADAAKARDTIYFPWATDVPDVFFRTHPGSLPPVLGQAMKRLYPDITPDARRYWWRSQVAAYIMRPNGAAMQRLRELRMDPKLHQGFHLTKGKDSGTVLKMPFPVPEGAFNMHVRHGDKGYVIPLPCCS